MSKLIERNALAGRKVKKRLHQLLDGLEGRWWQFVVHSMSLNMFIVCLFSLTRKLSWALGLIGTIAAAVHFLRVAFSFRSRAYALVGEAQA